MPNSPMKTLLFIYLYHPKQKQLSILVNNSFTVALEGSLVGDCLIKRCQLSHTRFSSQGFTNSHTLAETLCMVTLL